MAPTATSPVRMPKSASTYDSATQDPELRSEINTVLLRDGHIARIQEHLLHTLHASPTNWPTLIQNHALSLLRSGEIHTFPQLMERVLEDIKSDSDAARSFDTSATNGTGNGKTKDVAVRGRGENGQSLAIPKSVVEEGIKITRDSLEQVCEFRED